MSKLDELIENYHHDEIENEMQIGEWLTIPARAELAQLRSALAAAQQRSETAERERDEARAQLAQAATLTPRRCLTCARDAAEKMRDKASRAKTDMRTDDVLGWEKMTAHERRMWRAGYVCGTQDMHDSIIALPLPAECADCNPLKPESEETR